MLCLDVFSDGYKFSFVYTFNPDMKICDQLSVEDFFFPFYEYVQEWDLGVSAIEGWIELLKYLKEDFKIISGMR